MVSGTAGEERVRIVKIREEKSMLSLILAFTLGMIVGACIMAWVAAGKRNYYTVE